nr:hypothetical protein DGKKSRWO_DGKKSRWO_CDS_0030 [uncultured phage]CAI9752158.1 hypothetical protein CVNMHQAP_CVNMHQAP_CDS_0030 [uncultured phage]
MNNKLIDKVNDLLLDSETFSNEFLPLRDTLSPIKDDLDNALRELKEKSENSTETADKVFYLNRYTDLIKKVESIFEARGKRLQQTLQTLTKLSATMTDDASNEDVESETDGVANVENLSPEQCNAIMKILNEQKDK